MLRIWTSVCIAFILSCPGLCPAQSSPAQNAAGSPSQAGSSGPQSSPAAAPATAAGEDDEDSPDIPAIARGHISDGEYLLLRDQHLGRLRGLDDLARNPQARSQAIRKMEGQEKNVQRQRASAAKVSGPIPGLPLPLVWTPLGPDPIPNGQVQAGSPVPVSGRVTAIAVDPTTENTVYVGTAQGGLYRSLDGGSTWTALTDQALTSAIGAITIDPKDSTIVFVGTGEGNFSIDSFFGVGLYIITGANSVSPVLNGPFNAPTTFPNPNPDGFTDVFTGRSITRILVNPGNDSQILVSTASGLSGASGDVLPTRATRGVYASSNVFSAPGVVGTPTFTRLTIQTPTNENVTDMVMDPNPANSNLVLVSVIGSTTGADGGIWVTNNAWATTPTWTRTLVKTGKTFTINGGPATPVTKFAVSRSTGGTPTTTFFAVFDEVPANCASSRTGTMRSSPDGVTWTDIPAAGGFCGGQCWYDMAVAAHPTDATKLYIGGNAGGTIGACGSGAMGISTDGGKTFTTSETSLHADSHATVVSQSKPLVVYAGNDGGIFRSDDGGSTWNSLNNSGFTATQFESLAVHPSDAKYTIGGTQDNGTEFMKPDGTWTRADFGDGGFSAIDQNATDTVNVTLYHTYFNQRNNLVGYAQITTSNAVQPADNWNFFGCNGTVSNNGITCADAVLFYAPLTVGPGSPNTVYYGTDHLYRSADQGATVTVASQSPIAGCCTSGGENFAVSAIGISLQNDNVRLVGTENGQVFATTTGANPMTNVTGPIPAKYIARAIIDPNNTTTAYVTLDGYGTPNHVWKTTNLVGEPPNPTWMAASTGLPDVPVNAFAVDPTSPSLLYAGTDIGVFNSTDGGATWNPYGTGLPRVAVFDLKVTAGHVVRIATHGRGMWEIPGVTPTLPTTTTLATNTNNTTFGMPVTLTATVNTNGNPAVPTGTMTFLDGGNALGNPVILNPSGQATLVISTLSVAQHSITAHYSGDNTYSPSTSAAQVITISNAPNADYSLNIPNGSATVRAGSSATFTINLTPSNHFTGGVNFSCTSGVPQLASCQFTPPSVALNGIAQGSTTLMITTTAPTAAPPANLGARLAAGGGFFALAFVLGFAGRKARRRGLFMMLGVLALTAALISCGGGSSTPHNPGTPAGTYTVAFTATSGSTTHQATITLNVQ